MARAQANNTQAMATNLPCLAAPLETPASICLAGVNDDVHARAAPCDAIVDAIKPRNDQGCAVCNQTHPCLCSSTVLSYVLIAAV